MGKKLDLVGQRFGRLVVVEEAGRTKGGDVLWKCQCDCGNECVVRAKHLRNGLTASCGCFQRERTSETNTKHGLHKHPLHSVWQNLMKRTGVWKGADDKERRAYIERSITVCDEWQNFENFYAWAISHGYEMGKQLDRVDNDRGYSPDNCHFVTHRQNMNNRRCTVRLSDGTPFTEFLSGFGIETSDERKCHTKEYRSVYKALKNHGEQSATMLVFDIALEQIANKAGFEYVKIQSSISNQ